MVFEYLIGIAILAVYIWLIYFAVKGGNMTFGFIFTGVLWTVISLFGWHSGLLSPEFAAANESYVNDGIMAQINTIFQSGIRNQGLQTCDIVIGAWFGAVLMECGISQALIRRTVEFGGDRPVVVAGLLVVVVAALFTSIFGIGAVIAIGLIVLPILYSLGIPKTIATVSYLFAVASGNFMNPVLNAGSFGTYCVDAAGNPIYKFADWGREFGWFAMIVATLFTLIFTIVLVNKSGKRKAWAAPVDQKAVDTKKEPPTIALLLPFMPTLTIILFNTENIPTFLFWSWVALAVCGRCKGIKNAANNFSKTGYNGVVESAGLIVFLLMLACITKTINLAKPFLSLLIEPILPRNALVLCIAVAVLAPLALFRGPLTMYGTAGPIYIMLYSMGIYTHNFLFPLLMTPSIMMNMAACPTQSYVAWGINYANIDTKDYIKYSIPLGWIACILCEVVVYVCTCL